MDDIRAHLDAVSGVQLAMHAVITLLMKEAGPLALQGLPALSEQLTAGLLGSSASERKIQACQEAMGVYLLAAKQEKAE